MAFETFGEVARIVIVTGLVIAGALAILLWVRDRTKNVSILRLFVQMVAVPAIFLGLFIGPFTPPGFNLLGTAPRDALIGTGAGNLFPDGLSVPVLACYYPSGRTVTCPIWQIQAYIFPFWDSGRGWGTNYVLGGWERLIIVLSLVMVTALVLGKLFCGWICPFGLYMDLLIRFRKIFKKGHLNFSEKTNAYLRQSRYLILALMLILSFLFGAQAIVGAQLVSGTEAGEYVNNYFSAPFCQVCPMRPLCVLLESGLGLMNFQYVLSRTTGMLLEAGFYLTSLNVLVLAVVTIGALVYRRFWCRICPLGGLSALFSTFAPFKWIAFTRLHKVEEKCTKCGVCKRVCPTQVEEVFKMKGGDVTASGCILCFRCVEMCPYDDALQVKVLGKSVFQSRNWLDK